MPRISEQLASSFDPENVNQLEAFLTKQGWDLGQTIVALSASFAFCCTQGADRTLAVGRLTDALVLIQHFYEEALLANEGKSDLLVVTPAPASKH